MPAGSLFPAFGRASAERTLRFMEEEGPEAELLLGALLRLIDGLALLRYGRGVVGLEPARTVELVRWLDETSHATRTLLRLGLTPMRAVHFDDEWMCTRVGCVYKPGPIAREPSPVIERQVFDGDDLDGLGALEADVVVVGTGAGGAVLADGLARRGHAVIMLEAGRYYDRADFSELSRLEFSREAYVPVKDTLAYGNALIPIPVGRTVGGTTTINSGTCFRAPDEVLDHWARDLGLPELAPDELAPHFDAIEARLEVGPSEPNALGGSARVIARGAERLGFTHGPLVRNAPGCDGQGLCCFGCPTDAKRSTNISFVPAALKAGAILVTGARVDRILVRNGGAYGVAAEVRTATGTRRLVVRATRVVLAGGAVYTPLLMMQNRIPCPSRQLGRNLSIHTATAVYAYFDDAIDGARGVPQGYQVDEFKGEGLLFEGAFTPLEMMALGIALQGSELVRFLESYLHVACFGVMIKDSSRGRVRIGLGGRPLITYNVSRRDNQQLKRGLDLLVRLFREAGARWILPNVHGVGKLESPEDDRRFITRSYPSSRMSLTAFHPLGTARMGADAKRGVVDPDHEVYGTANLHVVDGAVIPGSLGVNPQVTIMAMASRAAARLHAKLGGR